MSDYELSSFYFNTKMGIKKIKEKKFAKNVKVSQLYVYLNNN